MKAQLPRCQVRNDEPCTKPEYADRLCWQHYMGGYIARRKACELCGGEGEIVYAGEDQGRPCECTRAERQRIEAQREDAHEATYRNN